MMMMAEVEVVMICNGDDEKEDLQIFAMWRYGAMLYFCSENIDTEPTIEALLMIGFKLQSGVCIAPSENMQRSQKKRSA